jgi:hypothetical protein
MVAIIALCAKMVGISRYPSMPCRCICPCSGWEKVATPPTMRNSRLPKTAMAMATSPMRPARLVAR